ncbi:Xylose isomerase-like TIM barrel [Natronincola peptidivorans]|uniref:Xylose isomerase-like TIM barrel n=1 Tax=Natronincola peptidivorans TaxID=426128 RepID=A0A1I0F2N8_9FIRM|nr:TIM barrel protein [Natronincola peptidivorans]SET52292.1 Xylose isomerase-like TIM barrel [Natronincola peptidivorans]
MPSIGIGCSLEDFNTKSKYNEFTVINIENPLYTGYLEKHSDEDIAFINELTGYKYIVDGAYIDLNPGTSEPKIRQITMEKIIESIEFAKKIKAEEVIFLSNFIPFINVDFYEKGWLEASKRFWEEILKKNNDIKISLCNTFEFNPEYLIDIVEHVNKDNFGLAFDIGHALLWGKISILAWYKKIEKHLDTIYLHSNDGKGDLHISFRNGILAEKKYEFEEILKLAKKRNNNLILKYFDKGKIIDDKNDLEKLIG